MDKLKNRIIVKKVIAGISIGISAFVAGEALMAQEVPQAAESQIITGTAVERARQRLVIEVMRRIEAAKTQEGLTEEQAVIGMQRAMETFDLGIATMELMHRQRRTNPTPTDINNVMNDAYRAFTNELREFGSMVTPTRNMRNPNLSERDYEIEELE